MPEPKPSIGRIVLVRTIQGDKPISEYRPAIITRILSPEETPIHDPETHERLPDIDPGQFLEVVAFGGEQSAEKIIVSPEEGLHTGIGWIWPPRA